MIVPKVIFEDSQILVIDKPSGVVVNRAESVKEKTIQDWIEAKFQIPNSPAKRDPALRDKFQMLTQKSSILDQSIGTNSKFQISNSEEFYQRSGIAHRLDKETSGLLVIAKTPEAFENLKLQFKERRVKKKYLALVHGKMEAKAGEIYLPIKRLPWDRKKFGIIPGGKKSRTKFKVVTSYKLQVTSYTFLEVEPETGRTHQIRVHLKHLGHSLVGDLKYSGRRVKKDQEFCPRLFLHASHLSFTHPKTGQKIEFKSPLPQDLEKTLQSLNRVE